MNEKLNFRDDLLRELIRKNKLSQHKVAKALRMSDKTFSNKMNGYIDWKLNEIQRMQRLLNGMDVNLVFNL
jgi:transcriptional regulator with XRE-family HTH domain